MFQARPLCALDGHVLRFTALPLTWATPATLHQLYSIMVWSINALGVALASSIVLIVQVEQPPRFCCWQTRATNKEPAAALTATLGARRFPRPTFRSWLS